jgi:hypothetical protein
MIPVLLLSFCFCRSNSVVQFLSVCFSRSDSLVLILSPSFSRRASYQGIALAMPLMFSFDAPLGAPSVAIIVDSDLGA